MTVSAKKKLLREKMRERERSLSEKYLLYSSFEICRRLVAMPAFDMAKSIFCFIGVRGEIDTQPILEAALSQNKALYVPRCVSAGIMELCRLHSLSELIPGAFGIPEPPETAERTQPDSIDLAVIPCLACARDGRRLGRGGGYYDRFLAAYPGDALLLCREKLLQEELPVEPHDRPVPWVLSEHTLYEDGVPELA